MSFWLDGRSAAIIGCKKLKQLYVHWFGCNGKFNNISIFMNKKNDDSPKISHQMLLLFLLY